MQREHSNEYVEQKACEGKLTRNAAIDDLEIETMVLFPECSIANQTACSLHLAHPYRRIVSSLSAL